MNSLPLLIIAFLFISFAVGNYCINSIFPKLKLKKSSLILWFGSNQNKTETEILFLSLAICWILYFSIIVATGMYHEFKRWEYLYVCTPMASIYFFIPFFFGMEKEKPILERYYVKANVWIGILSYVGNFYWTHYFYNLLCAKYTFDAHRLNDVPISMYMATHAYFCFYHSLTNICIRRMRRTVRYSSSTITDSERLILNALFIGILAYTTAFMETKTIEGFDYWEFENRDRALVVGSGVYMLYFIVSFPKFIQVDEEEEEKSILNSSSTTMKTIKTNRRITRSVFKKQEEKRKSFVWPMSRVIWDSLGSCMLVTILLDIWRLLIGKVY